MYTLVLYQNNNDICVRNPTILVILSLNDITVNTGQIT